MRSVKVGVVCGKCVEKNHPFPNSRSDPDSNSEAEEEAVSVYLHYVYI